MRYRAIREFPFYPDGFTRRDVKVGEMLPSLPTGQEEGLLAEGFVEAHWPEEEAKAIAAAPENKAILAAPGNKRRR